jgi:hypothetical protein
LYSPKEKNTHDFPPVFPHAMCLFKELTMVHGFAQQMNIFWNDKVGIVLSVHIFCAQNMTAYIQNENVYWKRQSIFEITQIFLKNKYFLKVQILLEIKHKYNRVTWTL